MGVCAAAMVMSMTANAQDYTYKWTADKGDGTYVNPMINADFPDCDVIRVGDTFYFVSTTMYHFPGATLLKSKDLVNWEYCANPLEKIDSNNAYDLMGASHYSQGQWAASLNYHDGKFYIYFICYGRSGVDNTQNILLTATDPEGEWTMTKMNDHYYDSGWLFDDGENGDGYLYVACGIGDIYVNKLSAKTLNKISSTRVASLGNGLEGSHMYHIGDYYYIYATYGGTEGSQTIFRSKNPMGPYEEHEGRVFANQKIHQGALVDTPTGEWWTVLFKDAGAIGRIPYLEPVKWVDGWPVIGNNGRDVSENGKAYPKPKVTEEALSDNPADYLKYLPTNDAFASIDLGMQWEWNHNPQNRAWSLTQRPGWMRLYSCTVTDNVVWARGSLTQRIIGYSPNGTAANSWTPNYGTAKLDISAMKEGDVAGLAVWQNPYSFIGVKVKDGKKYLYSQRCTFDNQTPVVAEEKTGAAVTSDVIYLRSICNFGTNVCAFYYSYDAKTWTRFGVSMNMRYTLDFFVGQRYYLFNYSTKATGGHVDIDWFTTEKTCPVELFDSMDEAMEKPTDTDEMEAWTGFPFNDPRFDPSLIGTGKYAFIGNSVTTSKNGLAGWLYPQAWDMSAYNYIVVNLVRTSSANAEVRVYDTDNVWAEPYVVKFGTKKKAVIDLHNMVTASGTTIDPAKVRIVGFSTDGSSNMYVKQIYLSDDGVNPTAVSSVSANTDYDAAAPCFDLTGRRIQQPAKGIYIKNGKKVIY